MPICPICDGTGVEYKVGSDGFCDNCHEYVAPVEEDYRAEDELDLEHAKPPLLDRFKSVFQRASRQGYADVDGLTKGQVRKMRKQGRQAKHISEKLQSRRRDEALDAGKDMGKAVGFFVMDIFCPGLR